MIKPGNSAGRLYRILEEALSKSPDNKILQVWSQVFKIDSEDLFQVMDRLLKLRKLVDEAEASISALENFENRNTLLSPFPNIKSALLYANLDGKWSSPKENLSGNVMTTLELCSMALSANGIEENVISEEDLAGLRDFIQVLLDRVDKTDFDEVFKKVLIRKLKDIREAILDYQFMGVEALKQALEDSLYVIFLLQRQEVSSEEEEEISKGVKTVLQKLGMFIKYATQTVANVAVEIAIEGTIQNFLLPPKQ